MSTDPDTTTDDTTDSTDVQERLDRLESLVEAQQETIEAQQAELNRRAEQLEALRGTDEEGADGTAADGTVDSDESPTETRADSPFDSAGDTTPEEAAAESGDDRPGSVATRRAVLTSGGVLGMFGLGVGSASADSQGQVGTSSDALSKLYTAELNGGITGDTPLTNLTGTGLQIASGSLDLDQSITPTWTGTHTWDTGGSANLTVDETGVYYSTANSETLNIQNSGDGSVTLQEDGTPVVTESRSLTGGHAIQSLGDLSSDRTVAVDSTALAGNGLTNNGGSLGIDTGGVGTTELDSDSVTVAGNSVSLGESTGVNYVDLGDTGSSFPIPTSELANDSVTVSPGNGLTGGGEVSLGGSTTLDIDTGGVGSDEIASDAVGTDELDAGAVAGSNLSDGGGTLDLDSTIITDTLTLRSDNGDIELRPKFDISSGGPIVPTQDDEFFLGYSEKRWKEVFSANGVTTSSDARLKQHITPLSNPLDRLRAIRPVSYEWNDRDEPDTRLGFVAQELDDTVPEAVSHPDDEDGYLGVNYDMVLPVAVGAIQEQQEEIAELEAENADIRAENEALRERVAAIEAHVGLGDAGEGVSADD